MSILLNNGRVNIVAEKSSTGVHSLVVNYKAMKERYVDCWSSISNKAFFKKKKKENSNRFQVSPDPIEIFVRF